MSSSSSSSSSCSRLHGGTQFHPLQSCLMVVRLQLLPIPSSGSVPTVTLVQKKLMGHLWAPPPHPKKTQRMGSNPCKCNQSDLVGVTLFRRCKFEGGFLGRLLPPFLFFFFPEKTNQVIFVGVVSFLSPSPKSYHCHLFFLKTHDRDMKKHFGLKQ